MKGGTMTRMAIIAALVMALAAPSALAAEPAVEPPPSRPGMAPVKPAPTFTCVPVKGNPELERAQTETPPPTGPEGQPTPQRSGNSGACPPGSVGVSKPSPGVKHGRPTHAAALNTATAAAAGPGYFYVGDIWESPTPKWVGAVSGMEFSGPTIPEGAAAGAHSIIENLMAGPATCREGTQSVDTIEIGWRRERIDTEQRWGGPRLFEFLTPDCYGERSCYNCDIVLANGEPTSPFDLHYYPSDGTPGSRNSEGVTPFRGAYLIGSREYKGAMWLWFGNRWVGRVSNTAWADATHPGGAFKSSKEVETYGEVFDVNPPVSQMGNGNKGGCLCATGIVGPQLAKKPINASEEPVWGAPVAFHNPLANVSPGRYTWGNLGGGGTTVHLGG